MAETTGEPGDGAAEVLDRPLPDGVRRRVVQIVSDGFGGLTLGELPAHLVYERMGAAYGTFGDADAQINGDSAGFHRIERG
ncbi:hypothetical protein ACVNF4_08855, partial [Streptomyces sp. S6]